jgi:Flp pilus assembly protein TadD
VDWSQHQTLGVGYEGTGQLREAISEYQQAIAMSGNSASVVALAHAFAATGKKAEAEKTLRDLERKATEELWLAIHAGYHLCRPR